ncbi:MAG: hypothetical protein M1389_14275 [Chloroflexi bacterium]|nr:hypothetical protein [Chloroflexota bacterium]
MNEPNSPELEPSRSPALRPVWFLFHWLIKLFVLVVLGIRAVFRPRLVRYGVLVLVVVGIVGWRLFSPSLPGLNAAPLAVASQTSGTVADVGNSTLPSSPVVEQYIQAEANYDAATMWSLLSDDMKNSIQVSGATGTGLQQLQTAVDTAKQQGRQYVGATYVGGIPLGGGDSVYFYVLLVRDPTGNGAIPYIYLVGPDSKIASIQ